MNDEVRKVLEDEQARLQEILDNLRAKFRNSTIKGGGVERAVRTLVRSHLPRTFSVGDGEIIDLDGNRSPQSDLVITYDTHPFTFSEDQPGLFFIEGVGAIGEIKSVLTSSELDDAIKKAGRHRQLRRHVRLGTRFQGSGSDMLRFSSSPPMFLFAIESQLTLEAVVKRIESVAPDDCAKPYASFDAVVLLDRGVAVNVGDGEGRFVIDEGTARGWNGVRYGGPLIDFLSWLSLVCYRMGPEESVLPLYLLPRTADIVRAP